MYIEQPEKKEKKIWNIGSLILMLELHKNELKLKGFAKNLLKIDLEPSKVLIFSCENPCYPIPPPIEVQQNEEITEEAVKIIHRRTISFYSTIHANDGHWPAKSAGSSFSYNHYIKWRLNYIYTIIRMKMEVGVYILKGTASYLDKGPMMVKLVPWLKVENEYLTMVVLLEYHLGESFGLTPHNQLSYAPVDNDVLIFMRVIGAYEWDGRNPMPPEFWLVPNISPIYLGKMLCYYRLVYMLMSYLYGKRFVGSIIELSFGRQTWDAIFAIQASYQVRDNPLGNFIGMYHHMSKGTWTFTRQDHGYY
ncbi:hypothetical protein M9H77_27942 [Catharanthus roseus]|uniref:Uncharacterized protein n=1 Tax=Catharanthus roseus TaxID=4058 RepID=A0ACC0AEU7_CATRO|nr:hypothetical protein M9H77_27942 [Catharanthus roseus]